MHLTLDIDYLKISGHEGRHRALVFIAGVFDHMPVVVNLMGRNPISERRGSLSYYDFPANMTKQFKENVRSSLSKKEVLPEWDRRREALSTYTKLGVCKRCRTKPHLSTCETQANEKRLDELFRKIEDEYINSRRRLTGEVEK